MTFDPTKYAGHGHVEAGSQTPPLLRICQDSSAEFKKNHKDHATKAIPGIQPGDIFFAPLSQVLGSSVSVIPLSTSACYVEWRPKKLGGGLVSHHPVTIINSKGYRKDGYKEYLGENDLVFTIYFFLLWLDKGSAEWKKGLVAFTSSSLKTARQWTKLIKSHKDDTFTTNPPVYAAIWSLSTFSDTNDDGTWWNWAIEKEQPLSALPEAEAEQLFEAAFTATNQADQEAAQLVNSGPALPSPSDEDTPY